MTPRLNYYKSSAAPVKAMLDLEAFLHHCSLEQPLVHLVKLRASQVNGCAYCIDMHWKDLRALGEPEHRLYALDAWRESPFYSDRERAALEWTEALTLVAQTHADDAIYERVRLHFSEQELIDLTFAITTINAWNRLAIGFRSVPGAYKSNLKPLAAPAAAPADAALPAESDF